MTKVKGDPIPKDPVKPKSAPSKPSTTKGGKK